MNLRKGARLSLLLMVLAITSLLLVACSSPSTPAADQGSASSTAAATGSSSAGSATSSSSDSSSTSAAPVNSQGEKMYTPTYKLNGKETAVIKTSKGTITVKFYETDAPIAVANFIELAQKGYYDGVKFHRYVPNFVIQGGDPNTKQADSKAVAAADGSQSGQFGTGGPGYAIKDEYANNPNKHVDGSLAMARTGAPDSGGSQFYFALGALPNLDGQYTVFGMTTEGLDVVHQLRAGDEIKSVTIVNASK
jgi:peptidyl-prolyl cis-trans isomerase B (cyclophilin B)